MRYMYQKVNESLVPVRNDARSLYLKKNGALEQVTSLYQNVGESLDKVILNTYVIEFTTDELLACDTKDKYISLVQENIPGADITGLENSTFQYNETYGPSAKVGYRNVDAQSLLDDVLFSFPHKKLKSFSIKFRYADSTSDAKTYFGHLGLSVTKGDSVSAVVLFNDPHRAIDKNSELIRFVCPNSASRDKFPSNLFYTYTFSDFSSCSLDSVGIYYFCCSATVYNPGVSTTYTGNPFYLNYLRLEFED